jgi:phosphatidylserine/phosphatidylglycerophosphate/cardiolipin synthase-like enzyme
MSWNNREKTVVAKFLNTSATNYFLEELIKSASERLILISPFLRLNDRIKELLEDKNRLKIDVRVVYGKNELHPEEINWLKELTFVRTSFCKNLHAKCYLNEESCIITSLNLYEFSQVNNNEMGVHVSRSSDAEMYRDAFEEAQRIIRISDEVRMSLEKVAVAVEQVLQQEDEIDDGGQRLTSSKLAGKMGIKTNELIERLVSAGMLEFKDEKYLLTEKGKGVGGEFRMSKKFGPYFLWPESLTL